MKRLLVCFSVIFVLSAGAFLWSQKWEQVAVLATDVSRDESDLHVILMGSVAVDRLVLIESRDGKVKDTYEVKHVYENHVLLKERVDHVFLAGSRIYQ